MKISFQLIMLFIVHSDKNKSRFGNLDKKAQAYGFNDAEEIARFQKDNNLDVDGDIGKDTLAALRANPEFASRLKNPYAQQSDKKSINNQTLTTTPSQLPGVMNRQGRRYKIKIINGKVYANDGQYAGQYIGDYDGKSVKLTDFGKSITNSENYGLQSPSHDNSIESKPLSRIWNFLMSGAMADNTPIMNASGINYDAKNRTINMDDSSQAT